MKTKDAFIKKLMEFSARVERTRNMTIFQAHRYKLEEAQPKIKQTTFATYSLN